MIMFNVNQNCRSWSQKMLAFSNDFKRNHLTNFLLILFVFSFVFDLAANNKANYISTQQQRGYFPIVTANSATQMFISEADFVGVHKAFNNLQDDIFKVTGKKPTLSTGRPSNSKHVIIAGTLGNSELIDALVQRKLINASELKNKWEKYIIQTIAKPFPGVESALVIVGSDKRGTIYGIYDVSQQIGVSPWHYWADVPVKKANILYFKPGKYTDGEPAVKYRGIFINDESPAFRYWATETFGGINHKCYETIFELLLRNKANYLWPAMWLPTMFNVDDPLNPKVADEYGIVVSTSHHEPMMRAHNEWYKFGRGPWDYEKNKEQLQAFWRGGIERMGNYESVVTVGMRGDGDEAMTEHTAVDLLQRIIADQRKIIEDVTKKPAKETPQVWAIYKEVQDYYDKGMKVDDDILILLCDDNWGNVRYLPRKNAELHKGGYGMYYHFDYVGAPVSYRWQNVTQIERVWEQMKLTYEFGVKDLWLVNVGDIKPMEFPISFFMDYAWNPDAIQASDLPNYYTKWAKSQFGELYAQEIGEMLALYTKYNARRTHEMLTPDIYSVENYREADRVIDEYVSLRKRSEIVYEKIDPRYKSAYYQLLHSPIIKSCNLYEMYVAVAKNQLFGQQGRASTNMYAEKAKELFYKDAELAREFHEDLEGGKWKHMMSQTKMGYTSWNHPRVDMMPGVSYVQTHPEAKLGFMIEHGNTPSWGGFSVEGYPIFSSTFKSFDPFNNQYYYIDVFNMGDKTLDYSIEAQNDWIKLSKAEGSIRYDEKVYVSIDWAKAPKARTAGEIIIKGAGKEYTVKVPIRNDIENAKGFVENNGVVSMDASNFSRKTDAKNIRWVTVPNLGRTGSALVLEPFTAPTQLLDAKSPCVEYDFTVFDATRLKVDVFVSPTQDFKKQGGLKFAVSINNETPQIININEGEIVPDYKYAEWWQKSVGDRIKIKTSNHTVDKPGVHTLKIWMIDTGIVFQKFVIDAGGKRSTYLGAPESVKL